MSRPPPSMPSHSMRFWKNLSVSKSRKITAMLFITHDLGAISKVADRILVMNSGHVVDSGSFDHILKHADDPYTRMLVEKRFCRHAPLPPDLTWKGEFQCLK